VRELWRRLWEGDRPPLMWEGIFFLFAGVLITILGGLREGLLLAVAGAVTLWLGRRAYRRGHRPPWVKS